MSGRIDPFARRKSASATSSTANSGGTGREAVTVLPLRDVYTHRDLQFRDEMTDAGAVSELVDLLSDEDKELDPIECVLVDGTHYVTNGHQRRGAYQQAGRLTIPVIALVGDWAFARLRALAANNKSQLPLSNKEKQRKVIAALREFGERSDRQIAEIVGVTSRTVGTWRKKMEAAGDIEARTTRVGRDGRRIDTTAIGRDTDNFVTPSKSSASTTSSSRAGMAAPVSNYNDSDAATATPHAEAVAEWLEQADDYIFVSKKLLLAVMAGLREGGQDDLAKQLEGAMKLNKFELPY